MCNIYVDNIGHLKHELLVYLAGSPRHHLPVSLKALVAMSRSACASCGVTTRSEMTRPHRDGVQPAGEVTG